MSIFHVEIQLMQDSFCSFSGVLFFTLLVFLFSIVYFFRFLVVRVSTKLRRFSNFCDYILLIESDYLHKQNSSFQ